MRVARRHAVIIDAASSREPGPVDWSEAMKPFASDQPLNPGYAKVVEDFCNALLDAARHGYRKDSIPTVRLLRLALADGGIDPLPRVRQLSEETGLDLIDFLDQCLRFPAIVPMVRERDGVKKDLRCSGCRKRERPEDDDRFWRCDECLESMRRVVASGKPVRGVLLFRTYTHEARCEHADDETLLILYPWDPEDFCGSQGFCERCFDEELQRRRSKGASN